MNLAKSEGEYSTERLYSIRDQLYHIEENGGARGSFDRMGGDGVWRDRPVQAARPVEEEEAVSLMLSWGYDENDIETTLNKAESE